MHGRTRKTINPRIPSMPGRSTSGFHRPGTQCLHQARSAVGCSACRLLKNIHEADLHMDDSFNELFYFPVWPLPETAMGVLHVTALWVPDHIHYAVQSFPLCGAKFLYPAQMICSNSIASCKRPPRKKGGVGGGVYSISCIAVVV